jgi:predicted DNA-binding transcriptional regulator AlpA
MNTIAELPTEIARHRVLDTNKACEFVSISVPHWRRMYRATPRQTPAPIELGPRKLGWRVGDLIDWLAAREKSGTNRAA